VEGDITAATRGAVGRDLGESMARFYSEHATNFGRLAESFPWILVRFWRGKESQKRFQTEKGDQFLPQEEQLSHLSSCSLAILEPNNKPPFCPPPKITNSCDRQHHPPS